MRKIAFFLFVVLEFGVVFAGTPTSPPFVPAVWETVYNKTCGYWIHYPKGVQWEPSADCSPKLTWPATDAVPQMTLILEVTPVEHVDAKVPVDAGGTPAGFVMAGGMKFEKTVDSDSGAGHTHVTVTYLALSKKHQYYWVGLMDAVDPSVRGLDDPHWAPEKMAQKVFDDVVRNFRPME